MRLTITLFLLFETLSYLTIGQVSVNNTGAVPDLSSVLDVQHSSKGMLIPRMTKSSRDLIVTPATSLMIYQTDIDPGYYYNSGTPGIPVWKSLVSSTNNTLTYKTPISTLPFNISQAGSYVVTKDLTGANGINVTASNVTIDLNFFTLTGSGGNTDKGIEVTGNQTNINIINGSIRNWGNSGIGAATSTNGQFSYLNLLFNGGDGLTTGANNIITNCVASDNILDGIDGDANCIISYCIANANGDNGIESGINCSIENCTSKSNLFNGIQSGHHCVVKSNTTTSNTFVGIETGDGNTVTNNTSALNGTSGFSLGNASKAEGNTSRSNMAHGFLCYQDVNLKNNLADSNTQNGFHSTFSGGKMDDNNSTDNAIGYFISGNNWLIVRNSANNNSGGGYAIDPSNTFATVITIANINTNTNPYANINF